MGWTGLIEMIKLGLIKRDGHRLKEAIFFAKLIIVAALVPIFSFQKVEGKLFSPLAYTLGFALLGGLILTLTLVPVLIRLLMNKNVREKHNPIVHAMTNLMMKGFDFSVKNKRLAMISSIGIIIIGLYSFKFSDLNSFQNWMKVPFGCVQLPYSVSLDRFRSSQTG